MRMAFKKIVLRLFALTAIVIGMNFVYSAFFLESDLQKHASIINDIREVPKDASILYIGESSNVTSGKTDADKRPISDFLGDFYPSLTVAHLTQSAGHAGIYKTMLANVDPSTKISTVVVTLNLRSFDAEWIYSGLETPLRKSMVLLQDRPALLNRFLLSFQDYPAMTEKERSDVIHDYWSDHPLKFPYDFPYETMLDWRDAIGEKGFTDAYGNWDDARRKLAQEFITTYAFQIDLDKNPRIKDFNEIIALAKKRNWNLVFNLMAENVEGAEAVVGSDLTFLIRENRDKLVHYFRQKGVTVVDNLETVHDEEFLDREWPTEHYNMWGRKRIAQKLAGALKKYHGSAFDPEQKVSETETNFTNDCEGKSWWANMYTFTREEAWSGKQSSKTGGKQEYSVNFQYPYQSIPEEARNSVFISLMVKTTRFDENTLLVMDISKANGQHTWKAVPINELSEATGDWQRIEHTFDLGSEYTDGELIEIYVYNISGRTLYVDDIDIRFR